MVENQENNIQELTLEQLEEFIKQTKEDIAKLKNDIMEKTNYLEKLLAMVNNQQ